MRSHVAGVTDFDEQVPCIENQHCLTMPTMLGQKHPIQALTLPVHKLQLVQVTNSHMLH